MSSAIGLPDILTTRRGAVAQSQLRREMEVAGQEVTTGLKSDRVAASAGDTGRLMAVEREISAIDSRLPHLGLAASRAAATQVGLDIIQTGVAERAVRIMDLSLSVPGGAGDVRAVESEAALRTALSNLNAATGGRALFAGANAEGPAVLDYDAVMAGAQAAVDGAPDVATALTNLDAFFATVATPVGDAPGVEIADGERLDYAVRSDDPGILSILKGYALVIASANSATFGGDDAALETLYATAGQSLLTGDAELAQTRSRLGAAEERIEQATVAQQAERTSLSLIFNDILGVDEFEAASRLRQIETQLEALYLITSRATQLSFVNFIR